jgi:hypothetical protein
MPPFPLFDRSLQSPREHVPFLAVDVPVASLAGPAARRPRVGHGHLRGVWLGCRTVRRGRQARAAGQALCGPNRSRGRHQWATGCPPVPLFHLPPCRRLPPLSRRDSGPCRSSTAALEPSVCTGSAMVPHARAAPLPPVASRQGRAVHRGFPPYGLFTLSPMGSPRLLNAASGHGGQALLSHHRLPCFRGQSMPTRASRSVSQIHPARGFSVRFLPRAGSLGI